MPHYRHIIGCKARPTLLHSSTNKMYKYCSRLLPLREAKLDLSKSHQKGVVWPRPRFFVGFDKVFKGQPKVTIAPKKDIPPPLKKVKILPKKVTSHSQFVKFPEKFVDPWTCQLLHFFIDCQCYEPHLRFFCRQIHPRAKIWPCDRKYRKGQTSDDLILV